MKIKWLSKTVNLLLYIVLAITVTAAFGTAIKKEPFVMTAVLSNSMYPEFQRGDVLIIKNMGSSEPLAIGDIVVFKAQEGELASKGWIVHRLVGGNAKDGYITKGDANEFIDQAESNGNVAIKREWIKSRVLEIGNHVMKIPLVGHLSFWMEKFQKSPYLIPGIIVLLAFLLGIGEGRKRKKKESKKKGTNTALVFFLSGLILSAMLCVSMITLSQHMTFLYEVSAHNQGVILGSNVGIMKIGDSIERPLAELNNKGFFPIIVTITTKDGQIQFSHQKLTLMPGEQVNVEMTVKAQQEGNYKSDVHVGIFYPFMFTDVLNSIASVSYLLAVVCVSLIPGLPLMLYPLFDSRLRRGIVRNIKHRWGRLRTILSY